MIEMKDKFKLKWNPDLATIAMLVLGYAVLAVLLYSGALSRQISNMLISVSVYVVLAVSLNLVVGLLGELSLGHAGFMSVGLFSGCIVSIALADKLPMFARVPLSMVIGGLVAAVFGFVVGLPALRLKGDYLAIVTLACCEIIKSIITNLEITGGARGLDTSSIFSNSKQLLPYAVIIVLITVVVMMNLKRSRHGRAIMAIRDNRIAAESVGINVTYFKLAVFIIAAFFAGAAGALYGHNFANVKATGFDYNMSIEILVMVVLGGMGSVGGSVVAAVVLRVLPEAFREFGDYRMLVYAIVLILVMLISHNERIQMVFDKVNPVKLIKNKFKQRKKAEKTVCGKEEA